MHKRDMEDVMVSVGLPRFQELGDGGFKQFVEFFDKRWRVGETESNGMSQMFWSWAGQCSGAQYLTVFAI